MVWTDPPYGIDYQDVRKRHKKILNDATGPSDLICAAYEDAPIALDAPFYLCCHWRSLAHMRQVMNRLRRDEKTVIVWDKEVRAQNLDRYFKQHEFILYAGPYGGQETLRGDVWSVKRRPERNGHPTPKPLELISIAVRDATAVGETVLDLFAGSGSAVEAAGTLGRRCLAMELDPGYVALTLQRLKDAGLDPRLANE